jgi:cytochrome c556
MIRTVFVIAAVALGVTAAIAQQDPIAARKALMKSNGDAAKAAGAMIKGDTPFDLAAAQKIFATFADAAAKMPSLYPAGSESEAGSSAADDFSPSPKVWEDMADFKARFAKFGGWRYRQERLRRLPPDLPSQKKLNDTERSTGASVGRDAPLFAFSGQFAMCPWRDDSR